jgi:CDP-2,3-bis-(O-geranylgeranyl)-sn-glycerol synthase
VLDARLLLLLGVANGSPILLKWLVNDRWPAPIDGGRRLRDGYPLFGESKTWRGLAIALLATPLAATLLQIGALTGLAIAASAMAGDLLSSFIKRRRGLAPHARAPLLDPIPESLLPLLVLTPALGLSIADIAIVVAAFVVLELALSRVLFQLKIRDRPY